jgi:hypothetical protein
MAPMPRFHIHIYNSTGETRDEEGEELPDIAEAARKAIEGVRSILSDEVRSGSLDLRGHADIANPAGEVLQTLRFADSIRLHLIGDPR